MDEASIRALAEAGYLPLSAYVAHAQGDIPMEYVEFPRWIYFRDGSAKIVESAVEMALETDFFFHPDEAVKGERIPELEPHDPATEQVSLQRVPEVDLPGGVGPETDPHA